MSERQLDAYLQAREALRRARAVASLTAAVRPPPPKPSPSAPWARQRSSGHWLSAEGRARPWPSQPVAHAATSTTYW